MEKKFEYDEKSGWVEIPYTYEELEQKVFELEGLIEKYENELMVYAYEKENFENKTGAR